jgi:hypothetical protein
MEGRGEVEEEGRRNIKGKEEEGNEEEKRKRKRRLLLLGYT